MRRTQILVLIGGLALLVVSVSTGLAGRANAVSGERHALARRAVQQAQVLDEYFARARSIILITAHNPTFAGFAHSPGTRTEKVTAGGPLVEQANAALGYLEQLYPDSIGEACFIDADGAEVARMVRGVRATLDDLSLEEAEAPFFAPTFALPVGSVYQAEPYVSPDTDEWVISNSTLVPTAAGAKRAIVHFEVTVESFRRHAVQQGAERLLVVNANGTVVIDTESPQRVGAPLGNPGDGRFAALAGGWGNSGRFTVDGRLAAYHRVEAGSSNGNVWYAVALAPAPTTLLTGVGAATIVMFMLALLLIGYAAVGLRRGRFLLLAAAYTDPLTGLYNRRRLVTDLDRELGRASTADPLLLIMCDLNGFKSYNDTFGHPAGDALLARLGKALSTAVAPNGHAYRLGGDEFCVLARPGRDGVASMISVAERALSEQGDGFSVTTSYGAILLPEEGRDAKAAMRLVDLRMYEQKNSGRVPADAQTTSALLRALQESDPGLAERMAQTAELADAVAQRLDLPAAERATIVKAARLHDIGKVAVPDNILSKTEPLTDAERAFLKQCPTIGERITASAPSLTALAPLIRASRERFDGSGYPDRLAGEAIPLGSRIIATCAAYVAMTSTRPHAAAVDSERAIDEIRRCCGTQFDPRVAEALIEHLATATRPRADAGRAQEK